jgi:MtN3 and saliva related transmembrane protein
MQMCGCADEIQLNVHNKQFDPTYFASPILRSHIGTLAHRHIGTLAPAPLGRAGIGTSESWLPNCKGNSMNWTQAIGLAAGILTASSLIPQVIKTLKTKKADEVSIKMLLVLQGGIILWILYGFKRDDMPIIVTNIFSLAVNITMVILRIRFGEKKKQGNSR